MTPEQVDLSEGERGDWLWALHEVSARTKAASQPDPKRKLTLQDVEREILAGIEVGDSDLRLLASDREKHVKGKIVEAGKVEAEGVFMGEAGSESANKPASRVNFHLQ